MRARPRQVEESRGESDRGRLACLHPFPRGHGAHRASTSRSSRTVTCQSRLRFRFLLACHYSFAGTTDSLPNSHCYRPRVYTRRRKDRFVLRYTVCHPSRRPFTCLSALLLTCLLAPHPYPTPPPSPPGCPPVHIVAHLHRSIHAPVSAEALSQQIYRLHRDARPTSRSPIAASILRFRRA